MTKGGKLVVSGVGATRAGCVCIPADVRTSGSLGIVLLLIMAECRDILPTGGIVTTRAGHVSLPADARTSGRLCIVLLLIMPERGNGLLCGYHFTAGGAFDAVGLAACCTGGGISRQRFGALVGAVRCADSTAYVAVGIQLTVIGVCGGIPFGFASRAGAGVVMLGGGIGPDGGVRMVERGLFRIGRVVTTRAGDVSIPTDLGAGRGFCRVLLLIVSRGGDGAFFLFTAGAGA